MAEICGHEDDMRGFEQGWLEWSGLGLGFGVGVASEQLYEHASMRTIERDVEMGLKGRHDLLQSSLLRDGTGWVFERYARAFLFSIFAIR